MQSKGQCPTEAFFPDPAEKESSLGTLSCLCVPSILLHAHTDPTSHEGPLSLCTRIPHYIGLPPKGSLCCCLGCSRQGKQREMRREEREV